MSRWWRREESGSQGPRYLKVIFEYELDSKEGPSCNQLNTRTRTPGVLISQFSKPELPLYHDPRLPPGWERTIQKAPNGACFVVISTPDGRHFKNKEEIASYLQVSGAVPGLDPSKVDFSVFGKSM